MSIIDFDKAKSNLPPPEPPDGGCVPENRVLSFDELETATDDLIALSQFTTLARKLLNKGLDPETVYYTMYSAAMSMIARSDDIDVFVNVTKKIHDDLTCAATDLCEGRLSCDCNQGY